MDIELAEAVYREGKKIKPEHEKLAKDRLKELKETNLDELDEFQVAQVKSKIEDINCFLKRNKWQSQ